MSDIISMVAPYETPLMDRLAAAERPGENVLHEWLEEDLGPNTVVGSTALSSAVTPDGTAEYLSVAGGNVKFLQAGMVLIGPSASGSEYVQITAITGNTITISRAFGGTSANSAIAGATYYMVSDAALEGADVTGDISKPRVRK